MPLASWSEIKKKPFERKNSMIICNRFNKRRTLIKSINLKLKKYQLHLAITMLTNTLHKKQNEKLRIKSLKEIYMINTVNSLLRKMIKNLPVKKKKSFSSSPIPFQFSTRTSSHMILYRKSKTNKEN